MNPYSHGILGFFQLFVIYFPLDNTLTWVTRVLIWKSNNKPNFLAGTWQLPDTTEEARTQNQTQILGGPSEGGPTNIERISDSFQWMETERLSEQSVLRKPSTRNSSESYGTESRKGSEIQAQLTFLM